MNFQLLSCSYAQEIYKQFPPNLVLKVELSVNKKISVTTDTKNVWYIYLIYYYISDVTEYLAN